MKILEVILRPAIGGAETLVAGLTSTWRDHGHHVDIVALDENDDQEALESSQKILGQVEVISHGISQRLPTNLRRLIGMRRQIRAGRYDVVHAHSHLPNMYARLAVLSTRPRPRVVTTLHSASTAKDYAKLIDRLTERLSLSATFGIVAVSQEALDQYTNLFPKAIGKVIVIPNGIAVTDQPVDDLSRDPNLYLAVGRITPQKDIITLVKGFSDFIQQHETSHCRLSIVGPFSDLDYLNQVRQCIEETSKPNHIQLVGPQSDTRSLMKSASVLVHAAIRENHPIVLLEAAEAGIRVVAADTPSNRSILGDSGCYFHVGDPYDLSRTLQAESRNPITISSRATLSRYVRQEFSIDAVAERYLRLLSHTEVVNDR